MTSVIETLWFPVLFVIVCTTWLVMAVMNAVKRGHSVDGEGAVTVRLPKGTDIVHNDGSNLNN